MILPDHTRRWIIIDVQQVEVDGASVDNEVTIWGEPEHLSFATQAEAKSAALSVSTDARIVLSALSIDTILRSK